MHIMKAEEQHMTAIRNIYAHHVMHGTGSFEDEAPDKQEMLNRLRNIQSRGFPWYVALQGDKVIGYFCISRYRHRHAYRLPGQISIYYYTGFQPKALQNAHTDQAITSG
ncbi:N-acetyltransferase family protein, partial [Salmonella enterica]|uniref:GNAT family N-acetyltransferase n=1 Tax=Salmonella enterica TaxID=28901 RepID=UPI00398C3317